MRRAGRSSGSGPSEQPSNRYESRPSTSWPASRSHRGEDCPDVPVVARDQDPHLRSSRAGSPSFHKLSSSWRSRKVSMHCQNEEWR